jgi:erythronate-4-phosphate dehydrogenase
MRIVVDRNIRGAEETFGAHGDLVFLDGRKITRRDLEGARALIVRTATRLDRELLEGTGVEFAGTTSIGTDHLDIAWLEAAGIAWANAPGCNADSAAQYTLAMIWLALQRTGRDLQGLTAGIIGRGNVGSRTQRLLKTMGVETLANDPPLAEAGVKGLVSLDQALECDIVCLHVPLTRTGPCPTFRMMNAERLGRISNGALLVNSARGDVIDGAALLDALKAGRLNAALDVWPGEPGLDPELLRRTVVATPHVAGYSDDGKRNGTRMVYQAFCNWAGLKPVQPGKGLSDTLETTLSSGTDCVTQALESACFVSMHDGELRKLAEMSAPGLAGGFDRLRREYPLRRDFQGWHLRCPDKAAAQKLAELGFLVN